MDLQEKFNFSQEQEIAYKEFQKRMTKRFGSEANDEFRLYRFLRAREFNIDQAEAMFQRNIEWRKEMRTDTILEDYQMCEVQKKYFGFNFLGWDKKGQLVMYLDAGNADCKGALSSEKISTYQKGFVQLATACEKIMKEQSERCKKPIKRWGLIVNFENFSITQALHKPTLEYLLRSFSLYDANYPERLEIGIAINTSTIFHLMFNILKPMISARTLSKVKVFGKDGWKEELRNLLDPKVLPAFLGGDRTDPDGNSLCSEMSFYQVPRNGPIPKKYYFRSPERRLRGKPGVKECVVKKMDKFEIDLEIAETGSSIEWEFETETGDIAFGLFKRNNDGAETQLEPIVPVQRVDASTQIEKDTFVCDTTGIYIFVFDNIYSWIRQKQVFYKIFVKTAGERKMEFKDALVENLRKLVF